VFSLGRPLRASFVFLQSIGGIRRKVVDMEAQLAGGAADLIRVEADNRRMRADCQRLREERSALRRALHRATKGKGSSSKRHG
jgi:hypothetical protein